MVVGKPVSINDFPETDGTHVITVEIPDHGQFPIRLSERAVQQFVSAMQKGLLVDRI